MAERQRADQKARHNLVADPEIDRRVEHGVGKGDRGRERDDVARKKRKLHPFLALGDAVAHGRNAARDLGRAARGARGLLDEIGKARIGLVGGKHVVIGGDDREIGACPLPQRVLVARGAGGEAVGEIGAAKSLASRAVGDRGVDSGKVGLARRAAPLGDAICHFADAVIELGRHLSLHDRPGGRSSLVRRAPRCLGTAVPGLDPKRSARGSRIQPEREFLPSKNKQDQAESSKNPWICLVLFVRIGAFQWVAADPNKNNPLPSQVVCETSRTRPPIHLLGPHSRQTRRAMEPRLQFATSIQKQSAPDIPCHLFLSSPSAGQARADLSFLVLAR